MRQRRKRATSGALVLVLVGVILLSTGTVTTAAYPHFPGDAGTIGVPGMTAVDLSLSASGPGITVTRGVTERIDLSLTIGPDSLCSLSGRWKVIDYLGVLTTGVGVSHRGWSIAAGLFLGPVRFDWGRRFGSDPARFGILTFSRPGVSVGFGIYWNRAPNFYGGITLFHDMRYLSLFARGKEVTVSTGGLL